MGYTKMDPIRKHDEMSMEIQLDVEDGVPAKFMGAQNDEQVEEARGGEEQVP